MTSSARRIKSNGSHLYLAFLVTSTLILAWNLLVGLYVEELNTAKLAPEDKYLVSTPVFKLGNTQTLCHLVEFQVVCKTTPRIKSIPVYPMFAEYYVDGNGGKVLRPTSPLPLRPIATNWFRPTDPTKYCGGKTKAPCANLGDELGPMLLLKLSGQNEIENRYDGMDVIVIGSVLNYMVSNYPATVKRVGSYHNMTVWGTGTK